MIESPAPHWILKDVVVNSSDFVVHVHSRDDGCDPRQVGELCDPAAGECLCAGIELAAPGVPALYLLFDSIEPDVPQKPSRGLHFVADEPARFNYVTLPPWNFEFAASRRRRTLMLVQLPDDTKSPVRVVYANGTGGLRAVGNLIPTDAGWSFSPDRTGGIPRVSLDPPVRKPQYFFVGGTPKSGTTWVEKILNAHPQVLCMGQGDFFEPMRSPILREWLQSDERNYVPWALPRRNVSDDLATFVAGRVLLKFHSHSRLWPGLEAIGDRSPGNSLAYQTIHDYLGDCRIIHCIRHPLDVVVSRLYHEWNAYKSGSSAVSRLDAAQLARLDEGLQAHAGVLRLESDDADLLEPFLSEWTRLHELALKFRSSYPELIQMVHYEQLLDDPEPIINGMFHHLIGHPMRDGVEREMVLGLSSFETLSGGRARGTADSRSFFRNGTANDHRGRLSPALLDYARQKVGGMAADLGYQIESCDIGKSLEGTTSASPARRLEAA